jgi:hypothetical protein
MACGLRPADHGGVPSQAEHRVGERCRCLLWQVVPGVPDLKVGSRPEEVRGRRGPVCGRKGGLLPLVAITTGSLLHNPSVYGFLLRWLPVSFLDFLAGGEPLGRSLPLVAALMLGVALAAGLKEGSSIRP